MSVSREHYDIEIFSDDNMVAETFRGVWSVDTLRQYEADYHTAAARLDDDRPALCLSDLREFPVQSQEVAQTMLALLQEPGMEFAKIAIVTQSATMNLQAKRVAGQTNQQVFSDKAAALRWLREENTCAAD